MLNRLHFGDIEGSDEIDPKTDSESQIGLAVANV